MSDKSRHERNMRCSPSRVATLLGGDLPAGFVRFGYDGGWGYQAGLHVAAPATEADDPLRRTGLLSLYGPRADLPPIALQHVGARWYDPAIGRFVQRDPIGIEGGMNVYAYCEGEPVTAVDPSGLIQGQDRGGAMADPRDRRPPNGAPPAKPIDWPRVFLEATGGQGHVPVLDPGPAQDTVLIVCEVVSVCAPVGAVGRTITLTPKALALAKKGWAGKYLVRIRRYIRYDRLPHHGKPAGHWDGEFFGGR
jgi:RHS repeat-associated protein